MKKSLILAKRNFIEMMRNPLLYIFCLVFPLLLVLLFKIIELNSTSLTIFSLKNLIPGVLVFAYSFLMLVLSLLFSRDKNTSLIKKLLISNLTSKDFIFSYLIIFFILGMFINVICILFGYLLSLIFHESYFNFLEGVLLIFALIPLLLININLGLMIGILFEEKNASGITSILIAFAGVFSGAWIDLKNLGTLEKVVSLLPFYPSTYIGRCLTKGEYDIYQENQIIKGIYTFDSSKIYYLVIIGIYLIVSTILVFVLFKKKLLNAK